MVYLVIGYVPLIQVWMDFVLMKSKPQFFWWDRGNVDDKSEVIGWYMKYEQQVRYHLVEQEM